jgi:hypothetical protein
VYPQKCSFFQSERGIVWPTTNRPFVPAIPNPFKMSLIPGNEAKAFRRECVVIKGLHNVGRDEWTEYAEKSQTIQAAIDERLEKIEKLMDLSKKATARGRSESLETLRNQIEELEMQQQELNSEFQNGNQELQGDMAKFRSYFKVSIEENVGNHEARSLDLRSWVPEWIWNWMDKLL